MKITFSLVIRIMALVLSILFFVPNFVVSCDYTGENVAEISPFNVAAGTVTINTDSVKDSIGAADMESIDAIPQYFILLAALIIIAILGKKLPGISMLLITVYIGMLISMSNAISEGIHSTQFGDYLSFEMTPACIISLYLAAALFIVLLISLIVGFGNRKKKNESTASVNIPQANMSHCPNCGQVIDMNKAYCNNCGAKLEAANSPAEEKKSGGAAYCNNCSSKIDESMAFCGNCGANLKQADSAGEENGK